MEYVRMGTTGTKVSQLCLGCMSFGDMADWMLNEEDSLPIIRKAHEAGINFYDTADIYSYGKSEIILGRALKTLAVPRAETVIATKVYNPMGAGPNRGGLSRKHIRASIDASLERLGTDYVDLYQIHRFDYDTPIEETIEALDEVVKSGKALHIGASSMFAYQFSKYLHLADAMGCTRFSMMQNHYNLIYREEEREMIPLCAEEGVGLIPWSPLASGILARSREASTVRSKTGWGGGRYAAAGNDSIMDALTEIAEARGENPAQVALAWLLSKPEVTAPIIGVTKLHQLDDPIKAVDSPLSEAEIEKLEAGYQPRSVFGAMKEGEQPMGRPRK